MPFIGHIEQVSGAKSDSILRDLLLNTEGPREAFGVLILCLYRLNFEFIEDPLTLVELADSTKQSILTLQKAPKQ